MNKYLVEYIGSIFFLYVIIATGNGIAIGGAFVRGFTVEFSDGGSQ